MGKGPGIDTITFREILTHRAGFRLDSGLVFTTDNAAKEQIRHGIDQVDKQVPSYNNINFTIFRDPCCRSWRGPGDQAEGAAADRFFINYLRRQVFGPVGVKDATCAQARDAVLMYLEPFSGTAPGSPAPVGPSGMRGGRLVYDPGQHAASPRGPDQRQAALPQPAAADG